MAEFDQIDQVNPDAVTLTEAMLGYDIVVDGEVAGAIEGIPGRIEYIMVHPHWRGKGVARAAFDEFIRLSKSDGASEVTTNSAVHEAMKHILKTKGFTKETDGIGWKKEI